MGRDTDGIRIAIIASMVPMTMPEQSREGSNTEVKVGIVDEASQYGARVKRSPGFAVGKGQQLTQSG